VIPFFFGLHLGLHLGEFSFMQTASKYTSQKQKWQRISVDALPLF
jgi:hypothetical protein